MAEEIIKQIDEAYPKVKDLVNLLGIDKGGWIAAALLEVEMGEHKHFIRCENCIFYECEALREPSIAKFSFFFEVWISHGVNCPDFSPKPDAEGVP